MSDEAKVPAKRAKPLKGELKILWREHGTFPGSCYMGDYAMFRVMVTRDSWVVFSETGAFVTGGQAGSLELAKEASLSKARSLYKECCSSAAMNAVINGPSPSTTVPLGVVRKAKGS